MRRSGALTLGVVLTLGGVTGGRGQELSGSLAAANPPPLGGFVLPALPENWADLPFMLTASQIESYNSNINGLPLGFPVPAGESRADLTSTTNLGFSTKANVYDQQLYLDVTYGLIRYLRQTQEDRCILGKRRRLLEVDITMLRKYWRHPLQVARHTHDTSGGNGRQLQHDELVQPNRKLHSRQRIFGAVQYRLDRDQKFERDQRAE